MIAVVLILGTHMGLRMLFVPPQPAAKKGEEKAVAQKQAEKKDEAKNKAGGPAPGEEKQAKSEKPAVDAGGEKPAAAEKKTAGEPHKLVTLGSADEASGYELLVTINSLGAAVERAELASQSSRDIDDASGYLGHLGMVTSKAGVIVNVVGAGTPAALAKESSGKAKNGILAGDVITAIGGQAVTDSAEVEDLLEKNTKPGETLEIKIIRQVGSQATPLQFAALLTRRPVQVIRPEVH